jgi:hypothetical protein
VVAPAGKRTVSLLWLSGFLAGKPRAWSTFALPLQKLSIIVAESKIAHNSGSRSKTIVSSDSP